MRHNAKPLGKTIIDAFYVKLPWTFRWKLIHINHPAALKAFFLSPHQNHFRKARGGDEKLRPDLAAARLINWFFFIIPSSCPQHLVQRVWCWSVVRVCNYRTAWIWNIDRPNLIKLAIMQSKPDGARWLCWRHDFVYGVNRVGVKKRRVLSYPPFPPFPLQP